MQHHYTVFTVIYVMIDIIFTAIYIMVDIVFTAIYVMMDTVFTAIYIVMDIVFPSDLISTIPFKFIEIEKCLCICFS
jgi:hypothetical protein